MAAQEKISFLQKFYIFYSILICLEIIGSLFLFKTIEISTPEMLAVLIFIIVVTFFLGYFVLNNIYNEGLAELQAQVAITQAQIAASVPEEKDKVVGFDTSAISSEAVQSEEDDSDEECKIRNKLNFKNIFRNRNRNKHKHM